MAEKTTGPSKGDAADRRCAFVADRPGKHDLGKRPDDAWCHGCQFYICDACDAPFGVSGTHEVTAHDPNESVDDDG